MTETTVEYWSFYEPPRENEFGWKNWEFQKSEETSDQRKSKGDNFWFQESGVLKKLRICIIKISLQHNKKMNNMIPEQSFLSRACQYIL